jgi:hypothetical protein
VNDSQCRDDITKLYGTLSAREAKYIRNLNRYQNNGTRREDLWSPTIYPFTLSSANPVADGYQTNINIIRSAVDTITSKVSQAKVRPFFNPVDGDLESRIIARQAQQFFDAYFDEAKIYEASVDALRDAAIFDYGVMYADDLKSEVVRVHPWQYFIDPAEYMAGEISRCMVMRKNYPLSSLRNCLLQSKDEVSRKVLARLTSDPWLKGEFTTHYDLYEGYRRDFFAGELFRKVKVSYHQEDGLYQRPFAEIFWSRPVKTFFSVSLADELYTVQRAIDEQQNRIDAAFRNGLTNIIMVPKQPTGGGLKATQLSNAPAITVEYIPGADGAGPQVVTPQAIHQQFIEYQNLLESKGYQLTGISQLSAMAKKPSGLDSGVALQTFEDIESERHNVITHSYIHLLVDMVKVMISTFESKEKILPSSLGRASVTWGDLKRHSKKYTIQFSAGSSLSKDPAIKLDQLQKLVEQGMIDKEMAATYLDLPDLQGAYSTMTAAYDYACKVVETAAQSGDIDYLPVIPLQLLKKETVVTMARLAAAGEDEKIIKNLERLLEKITDQEEELAAPDAGMLPPPAMPMPPMGPETIEPPMGSVPMGI